ncbi:hypothetical protein AAE478_009413 [Parahypoxylon ruwenzoriense]
MPPIPSFDCYSTLEVDSTATQQELTASYRRLARIHHPDKNPDNPEEATAIFQKIQLAYETLSDPAKRSHYDAHSSSEGSPTFSSVPRRGPFDFSEDFSNAGFDFWDDILFQFARYSYARTFGFSFPFDFEDTYRYSRFRDTTEAMNREKDEWQRREQERQERQDAIRRAREEYEAAQKQAKADAKKAEQDTKAKEKIDKQNVEQSKQEARWKMLNAHTKNERLATCLHSEFCIKTTQRQKFKCGACNVKRGIMAFECPYCSLSICQQCVADFTKKRIAAEKQPSTKPDQAAEPARGAGNDQGKKPANAGPKGGRGRARKGQTLPSCYSCGKPGHLAKNCWFRNDGRDDKRRADGNDNGNGNGNSNNFDNSKTNGQPKGRNQKKSDP